MGYGSGYVDLLMLVSTALMHALRHVCNYIDPKSIISPHLLGCRPVRPRSITPQMVTTIKSLTCSRSALSYILLYRHIYISVYPISAPSITSSTTFSLNSHRKPNPVLLSAPYVCAFSLHARLFPAGGGSASSGHSTGNNIPPVLVPSQYHHHQRLITSTLYYQHPGSSTLGTSTTPVSAVSAPNISSSAVC